MTPQPDSPASQPSGTPPGTAEIDLREYLVPLVVVIFVTVFLWLISIYNFALYHTTVEFTTIAISVAIFLLVWKSRKIIDNNYLLFIGVAFVFIAILDFLHTLVYQGIGIFPDGGGTLSTRFWIAARYMQAITLLAAPLFIRRNLRLDLVAIVYLAADIIIISSIFVFRVFPATYIEGMGLTPFKIVSEYVISLLLLASVVLLYRNRDAFDRQVLNNLAIAIFLTIAAELTFTEYASFVDFFSLLGHVFRLLSFYFFYRAIIEVGQEKPYNLLYRNLTESEKKYRALSELSPDAILVTRDGMIQYVNGAGLLMVGVADMNALTGKNSLDFVHPDDREITSARIALVQEEKVNAPLRELRLIAGGKIIPVEATGGPIRWDGKDAVQIVIRDITERKMAEDTLRASVAQARERSDELALLMDAVPAAVWIAHDPLALHITGNALSDEWLRIPRGGEASKSAPEEVRPETFRVFKDGRELTVSKMPLQVSAAGNEIRNYEFDLVYSDGSARNVLGNSSPLFNEEGKPRGSVSSFIDITERKRIEESLRATTQYLDNLIRFANAPIIVWDPAFRITRFNQAFELLTGMAAGEAIDKPLSILFPEKFRDAAMETIRRTVSGKQLRVVEIPILQKDGGVRIVLWNSATLYEADGKTLSSTIAQGQDITERKIAEAENIHARQEWERTFDTVPDLIAILGTNHRIIRANRAMADRLGITPAECVGKLCHEAVHGTSIPPEFCPHTKTCADGKQHSCEVYEPDLGGTFIVSTTPLIGPDGALIGTVHVAHDITDRKFAEAELLEKNRALNEVNEELSEIHEELRAANEDLVTNERQLVVKNKELTSLNEELTAAQEELHRHVGELSRGEEELRQNETRLKDTLAEKEILLSEIHHRVKNNLSAFISLLSLDGTYEKTDAGQALRKDLQNRARSMALIHETLYRTRKFSSVDMDIYLTTLIGQVAGSYAGNTPVRTLVDAKGVALDLTRATTAGLIINELVTNSFKYAFPPGFDCMAVRKEPCTIRVMLVCEDGTYCLRVSDNGCGMPQEIDITSTKSLGLKLVNFLARHQLRADIEMSIVQGTEFIFRLHNINEDT